MLIFVLGPEEGVLEGMKETILSVLSGLDPQRDLGVESVTIETYDRSSVVGITRIIHERFPDVIIFAYPGEVRTMLYMDVAEFLGRIKSGGYAGIATASSPNIVLFQDVAHRTATFSPESFDEAWVREFLLQVSRVAANRC